MISRIYYIFCVVVYASNWKWWISWQSSCVRYEMIAVDITSHPWYEKSGIISSVRPIRWSACKSFIIIAYISTSQIIASLVIKTDWRKSPIICYDDKWQNITISLSSFVVNLYFLILRIIRVLELNFKRNWSYVCFDLSVYIIGKTIDYESLKIVHV